MSKENEIIVEAQAVFDEMLEFIDSEFIRLKPWLDDALYDDEKITLGSILGDLRTTMTRVRERSLYTSLEEWVEHYKQRHSSMGVNVSYNELGERESMPTSVQHELTCILQEACGNALKHGKAGMIQILVIYQESEIKITIADNGIGVDLNKLHDKKACGAGVRNMQSRIKKLGGEIQFFNQEGGLGSVVAIKLPVEWLESQRCVSHAQQLGNELHDVLCPEIIGIIMILNSFRNNLSENEAEKWYDIEPLVSGLKTITDRSRSLSHELLAIT